MGVCTCMLSHVHLWRMLSHPPCGGCLSFNPESPDSAVLKSEVYIILITVCYIFPINIIRSGVTGIEMMGVDENAFGECAELEENRN